MRVMIYAFRVAGVTFEGRQKPIAWAAGTFKHDRRWVVPFMQAEPDNPHDPHAIAVYLFVWSQPHWRKIKVGYVPRDMTASVRAHMPNIKWVSAEFSYQGAFGIGITYEVGE